MVQMLFWLAPIASVVALGFAWYFYGQMMKESEGTPQMMKIAAAVHFLKHPASRFHPEYWLHSPAANIRRHIRPELPTTCR